MYRGLTPHKPIGLELRAERFTPMPGVTASTRAAIPLRSIASRLRGALWSNLAIPLFLDAAWAFLPAAFLTIVLVIRTSLEDRTLQDELEGYRDYAGQVRYRLLPGVW